jgi:hypothetical protein
MPRFKHEAFYFLAANYKLQITNYKITNYKITRLRDYKIFSQNTEGGDYLVICNLVIRNLVIRNLVICNLVIRNLVIL